MPIHVFWDNPSHSIIRQEFEGRWNSDDYVKNVFTMYDMMDTVSHKVHIIVDMSRAEGVATRLIASAPRFNSRLPVNRGLTYGIFLTNAQIGDWVVIQTGNNPPNVENN